MKISYRFKQAGFSLIEVLVALALLSLFLGCIFELQLTSLQVTQQAFSQTIAAEQLQWLSIIMQYKPDNFAALYQQWQLANKNFLPNSHTILQQQDNQYIARLYWHTAVNNFWHCHIKPIKNLACVELKGVYL